MDTKLKNRMIFCLFIAIEIIFCFTPLGSIPIGPIVATLSMVPVIIVSLLFGKREGAFMGLIFAICSFLYWTFILPAYPTAFLFTPFSEFSSYRGNFASLIICFLPRILAGFLPALFFKPYGAYVASAVGSLTNTSLVLLFIYIFFRNEYAAVMGKSIISVLELNILVNGIPECIICVIVCPMIYKVVKKIL